MLIKKIKDLKTKNKLHFLNLIIISSMAIIVISNIYLTLF
jgi:hypothetical protein